MTGRWGVSRTETRLCGNAAAACAALRSWEGCTDA